MNQKEHKEGSQTWGILNHRRDNGCRLPFADLSRSDRLYPSSCHWHVDKNKQTSNLPQIVATIPRPEQARGPRVVNARKVMMHRSITVYFVVRKAEKPPQIHLHYWWRVDDPTTVLCPTFSKSNLAGSGVWLITSASLAINAGQLQDQFCDFDPSSKTWPECLFPKFVWPLE